MKNLYYSIFVISIWEKELLERNGDGHGRRATWTRRPVRTNNCCRSEAFGEEGAAGNGRRARAPARISKECLRFGACIPLLLLLVY
jgi:hypothetical protein